MQNPEPPVSWKPNQSIYGGAVIGTAIAQCVIAGVEFFIHASITATVGGAITTLCCFTACYFIPD